MQHVCNKVLTTYSQICNKLIVIFSFEMNLHIKMCNAIIWLQIREQLHHNEKVRMSQILTFSNF